MTVSLRPITIEDGPAIVRWRQQPEIHDQFLADQPPTLEDHQRWFESYQRSSERQEFLVIADGRPVGTAGLSGIDTRQKRAEYGILIGERDARGQGIAYQASQLLLDHAFGPLGLVRVYLHVFPENAAAVKLYLRLGFRHEGLLRSHVLKAGARRDLAVMGILAHER